MSENGSRSSVDRERLRVAQQRRKKERLATTSSGNRDSKKSTVLFGSPIKTSTHLSERIQKNLGSYKDVVEVLGHKDAVDVYGADRLPETPISGSSAENHFERCFDSALLSSSLRDTERNKPSPLVASGAKMSSRPAPHKGEYSEGNSRGQSTSPSHGPASLTSSAGKAKHRSRPPGYEDRHKASRENPLFFQRKAQPSAAPPDRSSMDERHTTVMPKAKRDATPHGSGSTPSGEADMPRKKKVKSSKHTPADSTPPPSSTPRSLPPSTTPRYLPPSNTPRDPPPLDEGVRRQTTGKEKTKKEKRHKDRKAGRVPTGPEPTPPISQKVEGAPPISQKVEPTPPISQKVETALPISQKVETVPPFSQQVVSNSKKNPKASKGSSKEPDLSKKVKKVKECSMAKTAGSESASHPPSGTAPRPPSGTVPHPPLIVKPFQEAKPVPLDSIGLHRQQHQGGEGGSKLRPGRLSLGEGASDDKGTHHTQKSVPQSQAKLRIDEIIAEMTHGVVTPHSAIETPRKVSSAGFSFPVSSNSANTTAVSPLTRSQPVAPGPYTHNQPKDRATAGPIHSTPLGGGEDVSLFRGQDLTNQSVDMINDDLSISSSSSSSDDDDDDEDDDDEEEEEDGEGDGNEEDSPGNDAGDEGKTAEVLTPRTPILEKAMNMVKPLELITPIHPAPCSSDQLFKPLPLDHTFNVLQTEGENGVAADGGNDSASSGSDDSSDEDSSGAESDSESSDLDMGVEPTPPSVSVTEDVGVVSGAAAQLSSWGTASEFGGVTAQELHPSSWSPASTPTNTADTEQDLLVTSHSGTKSRTPNKCPRSNVNMLKNKLAQAPPSSASSARGDDGRLSITSSGVLNLPTNRVSRIPSTESTAFQPIAPPPPVSEERRSSASAAGVSSSHGNATERRGNDSSESGELTSSSSEEDEAGEASATMVVEGPGPVEESLPGPLLVSVPLAKVHPTIPTAVVHPKPQAEKQKAIVEPILVTPVDRVRRQSRGTSRDADDGSHLRYPHRPDYSSSDIVDYPSHSMQHRRHDRSHRSRSPRIRGDVGPQRHSHSDWRSSHGDSRWERRRRGGYHTSSQHWPMTADEYLEEARRLKHCGDNLAGHHKGELYLEAALMFMMSSYENEIANKECSSLYIDTVNLLEYILNVLNVLAREDPLAVICLRCQAILYFKAFETKSKTESSVQTQKSLQELFSARTARVHNVSPYCSSSSPVAPSPASVSSTSSCHGTPNSVGEGNGAAVTVPGSTFAGAVHHFTMFEQYFKSIECWRQSNDIISHKRDNVHFFGTLDERRGPISQYSSLHTAVEWAREGLSWFREDRRSRPM